MSLVCHLHLVTLLVGAPLAVAAELWLHRQRPLERWARRYGAAAEAWHDRTWERVFAREGLLNAPRAQPAKLAVLVAAVLVYHCHAYHSTRLGGGWMGQVTTILP